MYHAYNVLPRTNQALCHAAQQSNPQFAVETYQYARIHAVFLLRHNGYFERASHLNALRVFTLTHLCIHSCINIP